MLFARLEPYWFFFFTDTQSSADRFNIYTFGVCISFCVNRLFFRYLSLSITINSAHKPNEMENRNLARTNFLRSRNLSAFTTHRSKAMLILHTEHIRKQHKCEYVLMRCCSCNRRYYVDADCHSIWVSFCVVLNVNREN